MPTFRLFAAAARLSFTVPARPARRADRKPVQVQHRAFSGYEKRPFSVQPQTIKPSLDFTDELVAIMAAKIRACVSCHARNKDQPDDHLTQPDQECWTRLTSGRTICPDQFPKVDLAFSATALVWSEAQTLAPTIPCELIFFVVEVFACGDIRTRGTDGRLES